MRQQGSSYLASEFDQPPPLLFRRKCCQHFERLLWENLYQVTRISRRYLRQLLKRTTRVEAMDPVSAVGVAAAAVQFLDASSKLSRRVAQR